MPEEASAVLARTDKKFASYSAEIQSPNAVRSASEATTSPTQLAGQQAYFNNKTHVPNTSAGAPQPHQSVRSNSDSFTLPPNDANSLRAQQYPSTTATPQINGHKMPSPSDMFGGVEQLIRDSQDWVYRDQAQFATGFENWTGNVEVDPSTWQQSSVVGSGAMGTTTAAPGMSIPNTQPPMFPPNSTNPMDGYPMMDWLNNTNAYNNMTYNEDEWYQ